MPSHVTPEGYRRLEEEAARLWNEERPRLAKAVAVAAAEGDRSENAEYIYGKRKLAEVDRRLQWLGKRLDVLTIVDRHPDDESRVFFGAWVTLEDAEGEQVTYRIVGPDETDAERGWISLASPVAKALLKREEGDEVTVRRPKGAKRYEIIEVRYRQD
jgi:transcription elongation factor GreB